MRLHVTCALGALLLAACAVPGAAQRKPTLTIMPTQFFRADAESAARITEGLNGIYGREGYTVMPADRARDMFREMQLGESTHYADSIARDFGRRMGADLVAYPRLLGVGLPIPGAAKGVGLDPQAVVHLRVINVHTGHAVYFRQVAYEFTPETPAVEVARFSISQAVATASAVKVAEPYFRMVAGSRQEYRGMR